MSESAPGWAANTISALNGMFGDYLLRRGNGLAIGMAFYSGNQPLQLSSQAISHAYPQAGNRICVFVHGLACSENIWSWREAKDHFDKKTAVDVSYGSLLQAELGYTPFYLRYNSGLPIAKNGTDLSTLLTALLANYPCAVDEIVLIGHSMGGLVLRAACQQTNAEPPPWLEKVSRVFYLGTPHSGADLERLVHATARTLHAVPNPITRLIGDILDTRSQGVKDLRRGAPLADEKISRVAWLPTAQHYFMMGTITDDPSHPVSRLLGDALVRVPRESAATNAMYDVSHSRVFAGVHHLALAHDREVYEQIKVWCSHP
ncbi:alpha/beta fold hydrolase [Pseudolysobacter antarcticus]|uniref:Alpha/beta fold hydrolase n=1 Tax=Pseudolysobacter antarcticus TaxID=2511995 RepID=A0A411HJM4_9GAMM|nr:alpha/beta fold hydrolase [Pseudolysobacter antarcticus]QBB70600.1 alpha/beta fold hydrolase [Pseudolysobacter antarcticus]